MTVFLQGTLIGTSIADSDGSWTYDHSAVSLAEGNHEFTVSANPASGNSDVSLPFQVTVDQTAPEPSIPMADEIGGVSPDGDNVAELVDDFSGFAENEATVHLYVDGAPLIHSYSTAGAMKAIAYGSTDARNPWEIGTYYETLYLKYASPGAHDFATIVEDLAGNLSPLSDPTTVWLVQESTRQGLPEATVSGAGTFTEDAAAELLFNTSQSGLIADLQFSITGDLSSGPDFQGLSPANLQGELQLAVPFLVDDNLYEPDETFEFAQHSNSRRAVVLTPETFNITILNDDLPTVSQIPDLLTSIDQPISDVNLTVGNFAESVEVPLALTSDNNTLFPNGSLIISGSGTDYRVALTPAAGQSGIATITLIAGHGATTVTETFTVTVAADAGSIHQLAEIPDQVVNEDDSITIDLQLAAPDLNNIVVTAQSLEGSLLPSSGIQVTGTGSARQLTLTPAENAFGETTVLVDATNLAGQAVQQLFSLTVNPVNDPLTLQTTTAALSTLEDTELDMATLAEPLFTVNDIDTNILSGVLHADGGRITRTSYLSASLRSASDGDRLTFNGTQEQINQFFQTMKVTSLSNHDQPITLSLNVNDSGNAEYGHASEVLAATYSRNSSYIRGLPSLAPYFYGWQIPSTVTGQQAITVGFADPVFSTGAVIYEISSAGFVHSVEAMNEAGDFVEVWSGTDPLTAPGELTLTWPETEFLVHGLRITVDADANTDDVFGIDAVRLLGSNPAGPTELSATKSIRSSRRKTHPRCGCRRTCWLTLVKTRQAGLISVIQKRNLRIWLSTLSAATNNFCPLQGSSGTLLARVRS